MTDSLKELDNKELVNNDVLDPIISAATSENTRKAYQSDINHFIGAGYTLPASTETIVKYLKDCAPNANPRTIKRRVVALKKWHEYQAYSDPTSDPVTLKVLKGITRLHGKPKKQARAITLSDLDRISNYVLELNTPIAIRNRAIILLGFFGALRRSEIVALNWEQVEFINGGLKLTILNSKTDANREGQSCLIPAGKDNRCPIDALYEWRRIAKAWEGPVFLGISKTGRLFKKAITPLHVNTIVRQIAKEVGLMDAELYSAHSLRRGFATELARLGGSMTSIQKQGRWRTISTVAEYVEAARSLKDSDLNKLFD